MKKFTKYFIGVITGAVLMFSVAYTPDYFEISKQLDIFTNIFKEVNLYYVDETQPGELMDEAVNSMLKSLDPYTNFIPEERVEDFKIHTTGNYGGIGASIRKKGAEVIITAPYEGFAADKAGLKAGDKLIEVDGKSVVGKSTEDVSKVLKGAPGTKVELTIDRNGEFLVKKIEREEVKVKSVPYYGMLDNGIGYITLSSFTEKASREIKQALKELEKDNELKGLVLDLRGNPGGLLSEAVNVTNIFIEKGKEVVSTRGKLEEWGKSYKTLNSPEELELPVAVLINRGSASASEIVAGTLQDYDRGVVIGQRSFGKGLVQQTRKLSYGAQLKVTIAKYYTPSGRCIQAINYAERDEDGSVMKIPDSLRTEYKTANGRSVYDGGGVDPDIVIEEREMGNALVSLYRKMLLFDWCTEYARTHPTIADPKSFKLSDEEYQEFLAWLGKQDFEFQTATERSIDELEEIAKKEKYDNHLKSQLAALKKAYQAMEMDDLVAHEEEIRILIEDEIVSRYYYEAGRIAHSLQSDPEVQEAVNLLGNPTEYMNVLKLVKD